jgi:hypothetical protein
VFLFLSILFNIAIAVFTLVAGSHGWVNTYLGCNGKFSGIMESWRGIDLYMQKVDQALCSAGCPCYFTNTTGYVNTNYYPFYTEWVKSNIPPGNQKFQDCPTAVQTRAYQQALAGDAYFDPTGTFQQQKFFDYMANVENEFQCAGWCNLTYVSPTSGNRMVMSKYLFTDVNRGPPVYLGCLDSVIQYLPVYLNAFGSVMMAVLAFQVNSYLF